MWAEREIIVFMSDLAGDVARMCVYCGIVVMVFRYVSDMIRSVFSFG